MKQGYGNILSIKIIEYVEVLGETPFFANIVSVHRVRFLIMIKCEMYGFFIHIIGLLNLLIHC